MEYLLLSIPLWLSILLVMAISVLIAVFIPLFLRRFIGYDKLKLNNEVAGFKYAVVAALYGVLIAFLTMMVYEEYKEGRYTVENEARTISSFYRICEGLSDPTRETIRNYLIDYTKSVINDEWPLLKYGNEHKNTKQIVTKIWNCLIKYKPLDDKEMIIYDHNLQLLNEFYTARRHRMISSQNNIPDFMWFVLLIGGIITITFAFFFANPNIKAQILMTVMITLLIAMALLLIIHLDNIFYGPISIKSKPYLHVLQVMKEYF